MTTDLRRPLISLRGITKRFGRVLANDAVDFDLYPGEVHGLIGENGAGKTTLMKVLAGLLRPDAGFVLLRGEPQPRWDAERARAAGVGMVHQHLRLIDGLTVLENLLVAARPRGSGGLGAAEVRRRLASMAERFGLDLDPGERVGALDGPRRQWVAVARLLVTEARILILDEPTAFIGPRETERLLGFLRQEASQGRAVAFISHKLPEVLAVADRVTVLRRGRVVGRFLRREVTERHLARLMVGERAAAQAEPESAPGPEAAGPGEPVLALRGVSLPHGRLRGVNLEVRAGEVVGVGGVAGNGQQELVELLLGLGPEFAGEVRLLGRGCRGRLPVRAVARALAHIPGEVARDGVVATMTVAENCLLGHQRRRELARRGWLRRGAVRRLTREVLAEAGLEVAPTSAVGTLSGGMKQRLVVARALAAPQPLLLAEQPTAGLDLAAAARVHRALRREARRGRAVLLISYDVDELLALSDRVGVLYDGRLLGPYSRAEVSAGRLADLMAGVGEEG